MDPDNPVSTGDPVVDEWERQLYEQGPDDAADDLEVVTLFGGE